MSTIPKTRAELDAMLDEQYGRLQTLLDDLAPEDAQRVCVDGWTVAGLLAVRAWWSNAVADWVEAGRRGEAPVMPAPGYRWRETPRLNTEVATAAKEDSLTFARARLKSAYDRVRGLIDGMTDEELLAPSHFAWTGKHSTCRLVAMNTVRQYATASRLIRRALAGR